MPMKYTRWSPTLGELEGSANEAWGTQTYSDYMHIDKECVFFGVYGLPDLMAVRKHKGKRYILWAGTDILHLVNGYWLDDEGKYRVNPLDIGRWLNDSAENWCENEVEMNELRKVGIDALVGPSFMGNVDDFKVTFKNRVVPRVYLSVSGDEFQKYGWDLVDRIAPKCDVEFYLYGNVGDYITTRKNVFVRGRIPKELMNREIVGMQAALRPVEFDGASEIVVKGGLMGQYVISKIPYPHAWTYDGEKELIGALNELQFLTKPNLPFRNWLLKNLNKFPWVK